jgi:hypothetical protein
MAKYVLDIASRSGERLAGCTGSHTSIAVYDDDDLQQRLDAAKTDPRELDVTVRELDKR